jgi:Family of unknown function (DUF6338)
VPGTLEAIVVFAAAIAPGYGFLLGYQFQRSHSVPDKDLYLLAQAFICSAIWIAVTWWPVGHLLADWAQSDSLDKHEFMVWLLAFLLLALPYGIGRVGGGIVLRIGEAKGGPIFAGMARLGFFNHPTLWDSVWTDVKERGNVVLVITLQEGSVLEGQFAGQSKVDLSPKHPRVYLQKAYGYDKDGKRTAYPLGAYVDGDQIVDVRFKS